MKFRKYIICVLAAAMLMSGVGCSAKSNDGIKSAADEASILYDGDPIEFDVAPVNENGTVLVPMRAVFEAFGAKVKWDGDTKTVTARKKSKTYTMTLGENTITASKDDEVVASVTANEALQMIDDRTMIPIRALSELLGMDVDWDGDTKTVIITTPEEDSDDTWKENVGTVNLSSLAVTGDGISVSEKTVTISAGGDFTITGENKDAQIVVDTDEKVRLRLSGMSLTNTDGAPIYIKNADKCYITLEDGTNNTLSDGGEYTDDTEINGCIYAADNLEIKGKGTLNINGNVHHGITAKDSLEISNGVINITAAGDGIHVNDTAEISGGTVNISSKQDGIQSESILDINGGEVNITCSGEVTATSNEGDGFGGGPGMMPMQNAQTDSDDDSEDVSSKGLKAGWMMDISGGEITVNSNDTCVKSDSELDISGGTLTLTSEKKKGIKGMEDVNISGGSIDIKKSTEGIETKRVMTIDDGDISVIASDDGLNAGGGSMDGGAPGGVPGGGDMSPGGDIGGGMKPDDNNSDSSTSSDRTHDNGSHDNGGHGGMGGGMKPDNNNADFSTSSDGTQNHDKGDHGGMGGGKNGQNGNMTPPEMSGDNNVTPPEKPDGDETGDMTPPDMNGGDNGMTPPEMSGGNPGGGFGGGQGESDTVSTEHHIQINGGNIYINAEGDGIDSNASLIINGGTVTVDGPDRGGNSALDHDGLFQINGGTVIAVGEASMIENPASSSQQNVISAYVSAESGSTITIKDAVGKKICSYKVNKTVGHIMFSSSDIEQGETYTVYVDNSEQTSGTISDAVTIMGSASNFGFGGNGKGNK